MQLKHWVVLVTLIAGLLSGPSAMDAVASATPPIVWSTIPIVFFGAFVGLLFVVGLQLIRHDSSSSRWVLLLLGALSLVLVGSGISSFALSLLRANVEPSSVFFLALGVGAVLGAWVCAWIFRRRFGHSLI